MGLTIVIPFRDGHRHIEAVLDSLPQGIPVVVVDDCSEIPYRSTRPGVQVHRLKERGYFSGACNRGFELARGDVLILNQDALLQGREWVVEWERLREDFGCWGEGVFGNPKWPKGYVHGVFMAMRRDALDAVGGFNERDYPLWGATCEWQLRACRMGFKVLPDRMEWLKHRREGEFGESIQEALSDEPGKREWLIRTPPAVSVIAACHNYGRFLPDMLASLMGGPSSLGKMEPQTFQSFEVIIVDDASIDDSPQIGAALANPWKGVKFIRRNEQGGSPAAYNTGVRQSFGRYLTMLSADDMREPWALEEMYRLCRANPGAFIYDDVAEFGYGKRGKVQKFPEWNFERLIEKNFTHAGIMYPRSAWDRVGGYPEAMSRGREDWAFSISLGRAGYEGVRLPRPGYLYRREQQNRSLTNQGCEWWCFFLGQLGALYPDIYNEGRIEAVGKKRGCPGCGKRSHAVPSASRREESILVGQEGMVILEYLGNSAGKQTWFGPVTGQKYTFGGSRRVGYVDRRDAVGMAKMRESRKPVFRERVPTAAVEEAPIVAPVIFKDPAALSVAKLREYLKSAVAGPAMLDAMLKMEREEMNRKTAVAAIEEAIELLEVPA